MKSYLKKEQTTPVSNAANTADDKQAAPKASGALQQMANNSPQVKRLQNLQLMANEHRSKQQQPIQRRLYFSEGTEDLDAEISKNGITNSAYIKVQERAKAIDELLVLRAYSSGSEQAKFDASIKSIYVKKLPAPDDKNFEYDKSARLIAVTHETQHALDNFDPESPMAGKFAGLTGKIGVQTELNAFAAQAAQTEQLVAQGRTVEVKLTDMATAFTASTAKAPTPYLLEKMQEYAWLYSNQFKIDNPDMNAVKGKEPLLTSTKNYIETYFDVAKAIYTHLKDDSASRGGSAPSDPGDRERKS